MNKFSSKFGSQLTKTANGYKFSITKQEWLSLGKKAGWMKEAKEDPCWEGYEKFGTKKKNGKIVPNCIKKKASLDKESYSKVWTQQEMYKIFMPYIKEEGEKYEKYSKVIARPANDNEKVDTVTSDVKETTNTSKSGDYIVTNLTGAKEKYIISAEKLNSRYKKIKDNPDGSALYQSIGHVFAVQYNPKRHDLPIKLLFEAPWKENMFLKEGDMICTTDYKEVYRIDQKEFQETYK